MNLALAFFVLLLAGLGIFCGWLYWYFKREVMRLEARQDESLDDQDLVEFQERLEALLSEAREAGVRLADQIDERRQALERSLQGVKEAEQKLADKAELLGKAAENADHRSRAVEALSQIQAAAAAMGRAKETAKEAIREAPLAPAAAPAPRAPEPVLAANGSREVAPPKNQVVADLARQGLNSEQIARKTGYLAGEIDLILSLQRTKNQNRP